MFNARFKNRHFLFICTRLKFVYSDIYGSMESMESAHCAGWGSLGQGSGGYSRWASVSLNNSQKAMFNDQSWALPVFFNFFNNKKWFYCTFYKVNNRFLHQSYLKSPLPVKLTWQKMQKIIFNLWKILKIPEVPSSVQIDEADKHETGIGRNIFLLTRRLQSATVPILQTSQCIAKHVYGTEKLSGGMFCAGQWKFEKSSRRKILLPTIHLQRCFSLQSAVSWVVMQ